MIKSILAAAAVTGTTEGAMRVLEQQSIGIPAAIGIATTVFMAGRWLEHRLTQMEDRIIAVRSKLEEMPCEKAARLKGGKPSCPEGNDLI